MSMTFPTFETFAAFATHCLRMDSHEIESIRKAIEERKEGFGGTFRDDVQYEPMYAQGPPGRSAGEWQVLHVAHQIPEEKRGTRTVAVFHYF